MATTRIENDAFFTSPWLVDWVIERLPKSNSFNHILEPSGGAGAFISSLEKMSTKVSAIDISPQHPGVSLGNFLLEIFDGVTAVIGNPAFGRNCATAVDFIEKAASISSVETIAFILPRTILRNGRCEEAARDFFVWYEHEIPEKDQPFSIETQTKTSWIVLVRKMSPAAADMCCKPVPRKEKQFRVTDYYHPDFRFISPTSADAENYDFRIVKTILDVANPTKLIIYRKGEKPKVSNKRCLLVKCSSSKLDFALENFENARLKPEDIFGTFDAMLSTTIPAIISAYDLAAAAAAALSRLSAKE